MRVWRRSREGRWSSLHRAREFVVIVVVVVGVGVVGVVVVPAE